MTLRKRLDGIYYFFKDLWKAIKGYYIYKIKFMQDTTEKFEQLLITYGTLSKNQGNNGIMGDSTLIGNVETEPIYNLYDGGFPIVERGGNTSIKGELWRVTDKNVMHNIHTLEGCTGIPGNPNNWYDIDVQETPYGNAFIYVQDKGKSGRDENRIVKSGKWR